MYPILARYGPFFLYSYSVVMGLGIAAGVGLTYWLERRRSWARSGWLDPLLIGLITAIIGGRIVYVWINSAYFQENPNEIARIWFGGLNYHGALLAGLAVTWGWHVWRGRKFLHFAALLAPGFALVQAFGWTACWFEGCAFGKETGLGLLSGDLPDAYGVYALRYRTQEMGILLNLMAMGLALWLHRRVGSGGSFWLTLLSVSAGHLAISLFRGDEMLMIGSWRLDSLADGAIIIACLCALLMTAWLGRREETALDKLWPDQKEI
jgi:phosphatidylglycerol:prolipoprotein diacylglycerol transferase